MEMFPKVISFFYMVLSSGLFINCEVLSLNSTIDPFAGLALRTDETNATDGVTVLHGNRLGCSQALKADQKYRCDYEYFELPGAWYKMHEVPAIWQDARVKCHYEDAMLGSPFCRKTMEAMVTIMNRYKMDYVWTGYHATFSRGDYFSVDGRPLSMAPRNWIEREPDNLLDSEQCLLMRYDGELGDAACSLVLPYLCYKRQDTIGTMNMDCGTTDPEYSLDPRSASCYKFYRNPRTWHQAFKKCSSDGGYLAIINSATEAQVLQELFAKNPGSDLVQQPSIKTDRAFIGINDWNEPGDWRTVHGEGLEEAGYSRFAPRQPNNVTPGEFCGGISREALIHDLNCDKRNFFICEKSPETLRCLDCDLRIPDVDIN